MRVINPRRPRHLRKHRLRHQSRPLSLSTLLLPHLQPIKIKQHKRNKRQYPKNNRELDLYIRINLLFRLGRAALLSGINRHTRTLQPPPAPGNHEVPWLIPNQPSTIPSDFVKGGTCSPGFPTCERDHVCEIQKKSISDYHIRNAAGSTRLSRGTARSTRRLGAVLDPFSRRAICRRNPRLAGFISPACGRVLTFSLQTRHKSSSAG